MLAYTLENYINDNNDKMFSDFDIMGGYFTHYVSDEIYDQIGWKIHLSSTYEQSGYLLRIMDNVSNNIPVNYKFIRSRECYLKANSKQQNKIVTIYPTSDEEAVKIIDVLKLEIGKYELLDINIPNDFKISNNIYTRFCHFNDDIETSRYTVGIPIAVLTKYVENYEHYEYPFEKLYYNGVELPKKVIGINDFLKSIYINSYDDILNYCKHQAVIYFAWSEFNSYVNSLKRGDTSSEFELNEKFEPFKISDLIFEQNVFEKTEKRFWKDNKDIINDDDLEEMKNVLIEHNEQKMLEAIMTDRMPYLFYYMKFTEIHYEESMMRYEKNIEEIIRNINNVRRVASLLDVPIDSSCFDYLKFCNKIIEKGIQKSDLKFDNFKFMVI